MRDLSLTSAVNSGTRSLEQSVLVPEVQEALKTFVREDQTRKVLIGGLAVSYWVKPRTTTDADFLFLSESSIPHFVDGFRRSRNHSFTRKGTGVEVEVCTGDQLTLPRDVVSRVFDRAVSTNSVLVADPDSLVALKLFRLLPRDIGDIGELLTYNKCKFSLADWPEIPLQNRMKFLRLVDDGILSYSGPRE